MQTLVIVFLAVIAVSSLLQAAAAVAAAVAARKLTQRMDDLEARFERDLRPGLARIAQVVETAADVADKAVSQARRLDGAVAGATERVNEAVDRVARGVQDTRGGLDREGRGPGRPPRPHGRPPLRPRCGHRRRLPAGRDRLARPRPASARGRGRAAARRLAHRLLADLPPVGAVERHQTVHIVREPRARDPSSASSDVAWVES